MRSVGMLISRAFCIARRSRKLPSGVPPGVVPTLCDSCLDEQTDDVGRAANVVLLDSLGFLLADELPDERGFGASRGILPMQSLDQLTCKRSFGIAWWQLQDLVRFFSRESGDQSQVLLDQRVWNRHRLAVDLFRRLG